MGATGRENPYAGQGSVLLDIGGDVGALVVTMPATMEGTEVEIARVGEHGHSHGRSHGHPHSHRPHVAVVSRPVGAARVPSLVFPELVEGWHELCLKGSREPRLTVEVRGGEVTVAAWPA